MEVFKALASYVPLLQTVIWVILILAAIKIFLPQLKTILETVRIRIEKGSSFKAGPVELGEDLHHLQSIEEQTDSEPLSSFEIGPEHAGLSSEAEPETPSGDASEIKLNRERSEIYENNRNLFLTHVVRPSAERGQKYDIFIYLIRHKDQRFEDIEFAEFFLGPYWGNKMFRRYEQNGRIGLSTAAYGTFLCTCWVQMKDGTRIFLSRYIDFEMGRVFEERT